MFIVYHWPLNDVLFSTDPTTVIDSKPLQTLEYGPTSIKLVSDEVLHTHEKQGILSSVEAA